MRSLGEILIAAGTQSMALSTTAALLNKFSATGGANGVSLGIGIQPDSANNRVKTVAQLVYIDAIVELTPDAECDITLRVRKNGVAISGLVGDLSAAQYVKTFSQALTPAAVAQATTAEQDLTITGLLTTDKLLNVVKPTAQAGLGIVGARIKAADTLSVTYANVPAGGSITPTAETYSVIVARFGKCVLRACGYVQLTDSDNPGTLSLYPDTSGTFVGASGSPKTLIPIDLTLESSTGTPNVTVNSARLAVWGISDVN